MTEHAVVIAGAGPTGKMLAAELTLAGVDVAIVEPRLTQHVESSRAGGLAARTIEVLDQRGIVDRFLSEGQPMPVARFADTVLDLSDCPARHNYGLALWQKRFEEILAGRDEKGVHAMGKLEDGEHVRLVVREKQVGQTGEPTLGYLSELLIGVRGTDYGVHSPTWIARFTDRTRQAVSYRRGRVLLAGDAAHVHSPVGGQGLNLGVQDAVNLGWKLAQVVNGTSPESLLDSYQAERHPVAARLLQITMAQTALGRSEPRIDALRETLSELVSMDEPRKTFGAMMSGLDIHYDLGEGHPLLGRRMPDLDLVTAEGPLRAFELLHEAKPVLLNLGEPGSVAVGSWADRVPLVDASYNGEWELPVLGVVSSPTAVLVRPDGYVAWVGEETDAGLMDALTTWFGPPR